MLKITGIETFIASQSIIEKQLECFIDFIELLCCKRCWRLTNKIAKPYHHHGGILQALSNMRMSEDEYNAWFTDIEHGFCHGLMVAFLMFLMSDKSSLYREVNFDVESAYKNNEYSKYPAVETRFLSGLFHDFQKSIGKPENHDAQLKTKFSGFEDVTYRHSNPQEEDLTHPLIRADRIELMRYQDFAEWCDLGMLDYKTISKFRLRHFYVHVRPVIEKVIRDMHDVWISHVIEERLDKTSIVYPDKHWIVHDKPSSVLPDINPMPTIPNMDWYFSVNIGKLPVTRCHHHAIQTIVQKPNHIKCISGFISLRRLLELGGDVCCAPPSSWGRDHPFVSKKGQLLPISEWLYVYNRIIDISEINHKEIRGIVSNALMNKMYIVLEDLLCRIKAISVR